MNSAQRFTVWAPFRSGRKLARVFWHALLGTAVFFCAAPARSQSFTTPIRVSGGAPGGLPLIAVDSKNNIDVAWSAAQGVFFTRSTDAGKSFTAPAAVSTGGGGGALQMKLDPSGGIYLLWQGSNLHFLLSRSSDGNSFATPTDLTMSLNIGTFSGNLPSMALDASGDIDLVWAQFGSSGAVFFSRSTDGGVSFSAPVQVGSFVYAARAQVAAAPGGVIYVLWPEETTQTGGTCALRFNRSTDSGATFSPSLSLNTPDGECDAKIMLDAAGGVNVLSFDGNGTFYHSGDAGKTFSTSPNIFQPTTVWFGGELNSAASGSIDTLVNSFPNHDVLFSKSTDQGAKFSTPVLISAAHPTPMPAGAFGANDQSMAMDANANISVVWDDDILTPGAPDIFFSRSVDAGALFSAAQNLSNSPGSGSPAIALDSAGNVNIVWAAASAGKVFFSRAAVSSPAGFTISAVPGSMSVLPGATATAQLTLTATPGFNQNVTLSCGNLPPGAQCSFNPASVTPGISGTTVTLAVATAPTLSAGFPFIVNAATPTISQFQNMQINVGVLTGSVVPSATVIPLGGSANFTVTVVGSANFAGQFTLACAAPAGVACTFTPKAGVLPINGTATATLTVQILSVPAAGGAAKYPRHLFPPSPPIPGKLVPISALVLLALALAAFACFRIRASYGFAATRIIAAIFLTLALAAGLLSCGGAVSTKTLGGGTALGTSGAAERGPSGSGAIGPTEGASGAGGTTGGVTPSGTVPVTFPLTVAAQSGGGVINVGTVSITVP